MIIIINECFYPFIPRKASLIRTIYKINKDKIYLDFSEIKELPFNKLVLNDIKKAINECT